MDDPPQEVLNHYETIDEGARITAGIGRLELLRTREILLRHLPKGPCRVLDVGGATGVHAEWLAGQGHEVHVVDLVPHHVERVLQLPNRVGKVTAEVGDARRLPVPDASYDVVLLLGPLYHLTERVERLRAWAEARRVVTHGGLVVAAGISRFASLFDGLARGFLFDPEFVPIVERDLREGQHRNPTGRPEWFTTAYFHRPDDLRQEAEEAGLDVIELVGVEGLAAWLPQLEERWGTVEGAETVLFAARVAESEASVVGVSPHLLLVSRSG